MPGSCTCRCNFHNTKTLERNSKRKINEIDEQNREDLDHIDDNRTNSEELASVLRRSSRGNIVYFSASSVKKINYIILNTV